MLNYIKQKWLSDNFRFFMHFAIVFTAIFLLMTLIISQIMRFGLYAAIDQSLRDAKTMTANYVDLTLSRTYSVESDGSSINVTIHPSKDRPNVNLPETLDVVLYDSQGKIINYIDVFSEFSDIALNKKELGHITEQSVTNIYGNREPYRSLTVPVSDLKYPEVSYISFLANTRQLDQALERYLTIVITVMVIFWLISVLASVYLAKWMRKPIIANFERQKAFVENASHELRTPLAVLQNRLETLFRNPDNTILETSENIAASLEEVRNMRLLTSNLLHLARRDDGIKPDYGLVEAEFFDDLFRSYALMAKEQDKDFKGSYQLLKPFQTDKLLLKQILTILFDNALKYTGSDGQINLFVQQEERCVRFVMSDNGPGISDQHKKRVFDRFYRVDKARTRQKGGFGLGLSLAQQITDSLKGKLSLTDNQPQGAVFELRLPR